MGAPKEDPEDKKARLRERRMSELERARISQKNAFGMTSDLASVYGLRGLSMFGTAGAANAPAAAKTRRTSDR